MEGNEQFSIKLTSYMPFVTFTQNEAIVTITEDTQIKTVGVIAASSVVSWLCGIVCGAVCGVVIYYCVMKAKQRHVVQQPIQENPDVAGQCELSHNI